MVTLISDLSQIIKELSIKNEGVAAIPTDTIYGLSCLPTEVAVQKLLILKGRPIEKGLILMAHRLDFLLKWIDLTLVTKEQLRLLESRQDKRPTTYVVPAHNTVSKTLTGGRNTIAIRVAVGAPEVSEICESLKSCIVTSSANYFQSETLFDPKEINACFSDKILVYDHADHSGIFQVRAHKSSQIVELLTGMVIRS